MDRNLIVKALKNVCDHQNLRFQVIVEKSQLHIYINRKADYPPDYTSLTDTIVKAIADLNFDSLTGIWLYSRKLGEIQPDWRIFVESATDEIEMNTIGYTDGHRQGINFPEFEDLLKEDVGDSGLLKETGMIHQKPLQEEISISVKNIRTESNQTSADINPLARYCFVTNKKILQGDIIAPDKEVIRLVKFFHNISATNQQKILPFVDEHFKKGKTSDTKKLPPAITKWLKQITELNENNHQEIAIWLSRYCFDSSTTLVELKEMENKKTELKAAQKAKRNKTQYMLAPAGLEIPRQKKQLSYLTEDKFYFPPIVEKSIIPVAWTVATIIFICLGIYTNSSNIHATSGRIPGLCKTSIGSPNYCRLGVNLAGKDAIRDSFNNTLFPLTEVTKTVANFGCKRFANVKAGAFNNLDPAQNPVVSSYGENIFPNVYIVQAVQKDATSAKKVRVGCVYTTGEGERSPTKLASDIIPLNWPAEYYQKQTNLNNGSFGIYSNLINLGLYTLFSGIGIAIASRFKLGIKINNQPQTIYVSAFILGIVQLIAINLPGFNLIASIVFSIVAIVIISQVVKSFKINVQHGFPLAAVGILTIIAIQFLLYGISWQLINSFV